MYSFISIKHKEMKSKGLALWGSSVPLLFFYFFLLFFLNLNMVPEFSWNFCIFFPVLFLCHCHCDLRWLFEGGLFGQVCPWCLVTSWLVSGALALHVQILFFSRCPTNRCGTVCLTVSSFVFFLDIALRSLMHLNELLFDCTFAGA